MRVTALSVVPANEASRDDLQAVFGPRGDAARCQCQRFKTTPAEWRATRAGERAERAARADWLRPSRGRHDERPCRLLDGEPAGWCAVEPRSVHVHLLGSRVVWAGRRRVVMRIDF